jgi:hypothetical protein
VNNRTAERRWSSRGAGRFSTKRTRSLDERSEIRGQFLKDSNLSLASQGGTSILAFGMLDRPTRNSAHGPTASENNAFQNFGITRFSYGDVARKRHAYFDMQEK